jgi:hypothetical protein
MSQHDPMRAGVKRSTALLRPTTMAKGKKANRKKTQTGPTALPSSTRTTRSTIKTSERVSDPTDAGSTELTEDTVHTNGTVSFCLMSLIQYTDIPRTRSTPEEKKSND